MFILPCLYFSLLTYFLYKKQGGVTISVYMAGLYAITGLFAVFLIVSGNLSEEGGILYENSTAEFGILPTIVYCAAITLAIWPFTRFNTTLIKETELLNGRALDILGWFIIALSILNLYLVADSTLDILNGNFDELRQAHYDGEESLAQIKAQSLPFKLVFFYSLNATTIFGLPLAFYNICNQRKSWWFNGLLLFASLSLPITAIQAADRTEFGFFGLMAMFTLVMFWRQISLKIKIALAVLSVPLIVGMVLYLSAVSTDRFEKTYGGPAVSVMQYLGQGYINFCYFWDHAKSEYVYIEREFPLFSYIANGTTDMDVRSARSAEQGFFINVFPAFIGDLLLDITFPGMVLWLLAFFYICHRFIPDTRDKETVIHASDYLVVFLLGVIPTFGVFYYRYYNFRTTLIAILIVVVVILSRYSFTLFFSDDQEEDAEAEADEDIDEAESVAKTIEQSEQPL